MRQAGAGIAALITIVLQATILVHDWYPYDCCGGGDCHPVPCDELNEYRNGDYSWHGQYFTSAQVRPSRDAQCHVCIHRYAPDPAKGIEGGPHGMCVFVQQGA